MFSKNLRQCVLLAGLAALILPGSVQAQGAPITQWTCTATYGGPEFNGQIELQLYQYAGANGIGSTTERTQLNLMLKAGRAAEIPGTMMLMGEFYGPGGVHVYFEAPNIVGGQGTGGIIINGAAHRATYSKFYLVEGGVIALTEDNERIEYHCK